MIAKTRIALAATLVALIAGHARGEGLDLLRSEVRGGDPEHDSDHKRRRSDRRGKHHSHHGPHCDCRQCEDEDAGDAYALVGWMLTAPWWAPAYYVTVTAARAHPRCARPGANPLKAAARPCGGP